MPSLTIYVDDQTYSLLLEMVRDKKHLSVNKLAAKIIQEEVRKWRLRA
ncbi:hypothetical protein J7L00_04275 [Candidatus Bathyarchaeota archaeon]|nr:hypothetical protein [Candidatus Bathyarchaeota archaeon]